MAPTTGEYAPLQVGSSAARSVTRLGRIPALDGLRGLAFLGVFVGHAGLLPFPGSATVSMYVFFALSGFLITSLLADEHARVGWISLRHFFWRRALRLTPALALFLGCWLAVDLTLGGHGWMTTVPGGGSSGGVSVPVALEGVGGALFYTTNWMNVGHAFTGYVPLGHLWSLSVEEQIYLVWAPALALLLARSHRRALLVALACAVASFIDVALLIRHHQTVWLYMGTDARAGAFLLGGVLAIARSRGVFERFSDGRLPGLAGGLAIFGLLAMMSPFSHPGDYDMTVAAWVIASAAGAVLVASVTVGSSRLAAVLSVGALTYIGRRSYSLYLWHYVWLTWLRTVGTVGTIIAFAASMACAEGSWRLVEERALRHRTRFERVPAYAKVTALPTAAMLETVGSH